jgi:DNA-binding response OmpR family regulator
MKTILVLEDDCDVLGLLGYVLKQYDIIEAASDTQAIRLFNKHGHHIDLLLADVKLPLLNPAEYSGAVCPRKSGYRGRSVRMGSAVLCGIQ